MPAPTPTIDAELALALHSFTQDTIHIATPDDIPPGWFDCLEHGMWYTVETSSGHPALDDIICETVDDLYDWCNTWRTLTAKAPA